MGCTVDRRGGSGSPMGPSLDSCVPGSRSDSGGGGSRTEGFPVEILGVLESDHPGRLVGSKVKEEGFSFLGTSDLRCGRPLVRRLLKDLLADSGCRPGRDVPPHSLGVDSLNSPDLPMSSVRTSSSTVRSRVQGSCHVHSSRSWLDPDSTPDLLGHSKGWTKGSTLGLQSLSGLSTSPHPLATTTIRRK